MVTLEMGKNKLKWVLRRLGDLYDEEADASEVLAQSKKLEFFLRRLLFNYWREELEFAVESDYQELLSELWSCGFLEAGRAAFPLLALVALALPATGAAYPVSIGKVLSLVDSESRQAAVCSTYAEVLMFARKFVLQSRSMSLLEAEQSRRIDSRLSGLVKAAKLKVSTGNFQWRVNAAPGMSGWGHQIHSYHASEARKQLLECAAATGTSGRAGLRCSHSALQHPKVTPASLRSLLAFEVLLLPETSPSALVSCTVGEYRAGRSSELPGRGYIFKWFVRVESAHRYELLVVDRQLKQALDGYLEHARPLLLSQELPEPNSSEGPLFPLSGGRPMASLLPLAKFALKLTGFDKRNVGHVAPRDLAERMKAAFLKQRVEVRRLFL
jgi:hypothetical protein